MTEEYKRGRAHMFVIYVTVKKEKKKKRRCCLRAAHSFPMRQHWNTVPLQSITILYIQKHFHTGEKNKYEPKKGQK